MLLQLCPLCHSRILGMKLGSSSYIPWCPRQMHSFSEVLLEGVLAQMPLTITQPHVVPVSVGPEMFLDVSCSTDYLQAVNVFINAVLLLE